MNLLNTHESCPYLHLVINKKVLFSARKCESQIENARSAIFSYNIVSLSLTSNVFFFRNGSSVFKI